MTALPPTKVFEIAGRDAWIRYKKQTLHTKGF